VLALASALLLADVLLLNLFPSGLPRSFLYPVFFVLTVSSAAILVIGFTAAKELFPLEIAGTSVGTVNLFPFLGGAIFQPVLGWILDAYPGAVSGEYSLEGYRVILLILLIGACICLINTFMMKETFPASQTK
jgi:sugar phosphate permease